MHRFTNLRRHRVSAAGLVTAAFGLLLLVVLPAAVAAQDTCVRLRARNALGVPLHPAAGDARVSGRLPDGTVAAKLATDPQTTWIQIRAGGETGWITTRYVAEEFACPPGDAPALEYRIGCWNLEHFHDGASRGFPENTRGGPTFPGRTDDDLEHMASIIEELDVKILVLSEIFAREVTVTDDDGEFTDVRSEELEALISHIDTGAYDYVIGSSGDSQHVAILYDTNVVELIASCETNFADVRVQRKSLFDRQPLIGQFRFRSGSQQRNDLAVVAVHLASGQNLANNHDQAMTLLRSELADLREDGLCIPQDENDLVILGDFNANRFDSHNEDFWDDMEANGWDVLADDQDEYPATRLSGVPLRQRNSRIDYIIVSSGNQGLAGEEVTAAQAFVHEEFVNGNAEQFRRRASDHLPVTIMVRVGDDTDAPLVAGGGPAPRVAGVVRAAALLRSEPLPLAAAAAEARAARILPQLEGAALRDQLRAQFSPRLHLSYKNARRALFSIVDNQAGAVTLVYTGQRFPTSGIPNPRQVNTEHTWPQSRFAQARKRSQIRADLHHLFPTFNRVNGERGNKPFAEIPDERTETWWSSPEAQTEPPAADVRDGFSESTATQFEPREVQKGDVARALAYVRVVYGDRRIDTSWFDAQRETLLKWHEQDPPDEAERERNRRIEAIQGNANPFVDDPTLLRRALRD